VSAVAVDEATVVATNAEPFEPVLDSEPPPELEHAASINTITIAGMDPVEQRRITVRPSA
jgi:hypothetical protein